MKRLDVSQLLDVYCELGIDETEHDIKALLKCLETMATTVAGRLDVQSLGVTHDHEGILINFGPHDMGDPCPVQLEQHDDEGPWGEPDKKVVLICDDDITQHIMAEAVFESEGFSVLKALSAEEAWKLFLDNPVDLIVTDIVLPDEDGFSFAQRVISYGGNKGSVPIVTISGLSDTEESVEQVEKIGGVMHLTKPVPWERLARIGRSICSANESRLNYFRPRQPHHDS